jgi:glycosyltransferase involved in cell wall biosynthesis
LGVPREKIMAIPNAATFTLTKEMRRRVGEREVVWHRERRLRLLYIGRLDRQKGVDRLFEIVTTIKRRQAPVDIRIVGSALMDVEDDWQARFRTIGVQIEPVVYDTAELVEMYLWADALILPSRWEGAPLVIPECQQLGCIPIVADVGAAHELIDHELNGILIESGNDSQFASEVCSWLDLLATNDHCRRQLARGAVIRGERATWEQSFEPLLEWLEVEFKSVFRSEKVAERRAKGAERSLVDAAKGRAMNGRSVDEEGNERVKAGWGKHIPRIPTDNGQGQRSQRE